MPSDLRRYTSVRATRKTLPAIPAYGAIKKQKTSPDLHASNPGIRPTTSSLASRQASAASRKHRPRTPHTITTSDDGSLSW